MNIFQSLNEIETSPFFTASWEPRFLKKLLIIFGSSTLTFLLFALLFVKSYIKVPLFYTGETYEINLINTTNATAPHTVLISPPTNKKLFVQDYGDNMTHKIRGDIIGSYTRYIPHILVDPIQYLVNIANSSYTTEIRLTLPSMRYTSYIICSLCFIICVFAAYFCYNVQNLKLFFPLYFLVCFYTFLSLPIFKFGIFMSCFISMAYWLGFISISFLQVRILSSNIPVIYMSTFGVCGACALFTAMTYSNATFIYPSVICLLLLIAVSLYLFYMGTSILNPFLLSVHFGCMWIIGLSVYITTIMKTMTVYGFNTFLVRTINYVLSTVFIVFQSVYLVGEPSKARIPEAPLDQIAHLNRIDHLLETLAEKDEGSSKRGQTFQ